MKGLILLDDPLSTNKAKSKKCGIQKNAASKRKISYKWIITVVLWTFVLSAVLSWASSETLTGVNLIIAVLVVLVIISVGVFFDVIGVAVTAADETPFHSLASRKVGGAKQSIGLIRNAEKVGNFCNDVVGDICGIISGSASAACVIILSKSTTVGDVVLTVLLTAIISALTIGGKAVGKYFAFAYANTIVFASGKIIYFFDSIFRKNKK